jgi:hypothetical protein
LQLRSKLLGLTLAMPASVALQRALLRQRLELTEYPQ